MQERHVPTFPGGYVTEFDQSIGNCVVLNVGPYRFLLLVISF